MYEKDHSKRFYIQGIAFPVTDNEEFHADGWVAVLKQIRNASKVVNAVRLYDIDPAIDYSEFLRGAASLGFYVIVPLTAVSGGGVLNRGLPAPTCYNENLYAFGVSVIDQFDSFPNVLGYVLGNEIMNSLDSWEASPCIMSYARDLKRYNPSVSLMYTMQHDGIGAVLSPSEAVKLTLDYMTACQEASIDVLGVNIESWCSSTQEFDVNPDGSIGTYKDLYDHMKNATIPIFFSELGCSTELFNRDNGLPKGFRDWNQVNTILGPDMVDRWSGFIAYAYDGPKYFRMTVGPPWDGEHPLEFSKDMDNYVSALDSLTIADTKVNDEFVREKPDSTEEGCGEKSSAEEILFDCCKVELYPISNIPSYYRHGHGGSISDQSSNTWWNADLNYKSVMNTTVLVPILAILGAYCSFQWYKSQNGPYQRIQQDSSDPSKERSSNTNGSRREDYRTFT